jgi:hypothetical protein
MAGSEHGSAPSSTRTARRRTAAGLLSIAAGLLAGAPVFTGAESSSLSAWETAIPEIVSMGALFGVVMGGQYLLYRNRPPKLFLIPAVLTIVPGLILLADASLRSASWEWVAILLSGGLFLAAFWLAHKRDRGAGPPSCDAPE